MYHAYITMYHEVSRVYQVYHVCLCIMHVSYMSYPCIMRYHVYITCVYVSCMYHIYRVHITMYHVYITCIT